MLLEMNDHLKARVYGGRQCVAPTGTAVELMDNHEALRRVRDTNIDFLYVYPVLDFPEDVSTFVRSINCYLALTLQIYVVCLAESSNQSMGQ